MSIRITADHDQQGNPQGQLSIILSYRNIRYSYKLNRNSV